MLLPVRLTKVRGANYKAFEAPFELELAPLTLVFGRNGSGKTALVRLPLAIAAALAGTDSPGLPLRTRDLLLGNSLASFVHGGAADKYEVGIEFEQDGRTYSLDVVVRKDPSTSLRLPGQWIDRWTLREGSVVLASFVWNHKSSGYEGESSEMLQAPASFKGLIPTLHDGAPHPIAARLRPAPHVGHLGANRGVPGEDFMPEQPNVVLDVESKGASTRRVLGALRFHPRPEILAEIIEHVRACFDVDLRVEEVAQGAIQGTVLRAKPCHRSTWLPLSELGTGLASALPLLVQYAVMANQDDSTASPLLLCEEPEAHAHPLIQARLADVVVDSVRAGKCASLLETHSETFVLRVRRRVAEGRLAPEQVAFYWVDDDQATTEVRRLHLDAHGNIPDWPEGWFDTALHEVREIHRAMGAS